MYAACCLAYSAVKRNSIPGKLVSCNVVLSHFKVKLIQCFTHVIHVLLF